MAPSTNGSGEDGEVREHLLSIPVEVYLRRSLQRRSGAKVSVVNLERFSDTGVPLLSGVSLNVQAGQVVGIIGPSGSGKSTLLRCLNRLWEPPADSVFLDGEDVTKMNVLTTRRRIGMLFQTPILFEGIFPSLSMTRILLQRLTKKFTTLNSEQALQHTVW
jgi:ABC-type methionine transport system ATPase subunit